jgi:hypothetical protein
VKQNPRCISKEKRLAYEVATEEHKVHTEGTEGQYLYGETLEDNKGGNIWRKFV